MNLREALAQTRCTLQDNGILDAPLEGEILLRHITGLDRAAFFAALDKEIAPRQYSSLQKLLIRRLSGEPSAYIIGQKEFYGLNFKVDPRVLIPRPETELLVEQTQEYAHRYEYKFIADVGTGSGCIAVALAKNLDKVSIIAADISPEALELAEANSRRHRVKSRIEFLHGNLLEPLRRPVDLIVANLPYVTSAESNLPFEPVLALDGGKDGLDVIRELVGQVKGKLKPGGTLLMEIGLGQSSKVIDILHNHFPGDEIKVYYDLAAIPRVIALSLTA